MVAWTEAPTVFVGLAGGSFKSVDVITGASLTAGV